MFSGGRDDAPIQLDVYFAVFESAGHKLAVTTCSGGLAAAPRDPDAAKAFLAFLTGPEAGPILARVGMERAREP